MKFKAMQTMIKKIMITSFIVMFCFTGIFAQKKTLKESVALGQQVYAANCTSCHMEGGEGVEGTFPPLVKSPYVTGDTKRLITILVKGQSGEITVHGKLYNMEMASQEHLSDEEIADVLNYIRQSWGNKAKKMIMAAEVKTQR
jgi:mono/diheme cytochrome c family protein